MTLLFVLIQKVTKKIKTKGMLPPARPYSRLAPFVGRARALGLIEVIGGNLAAASAKS